MVFGRSGVGVRVSGWVGVRVCFSETVCVCSCVAFFWLKQAKGGKISGC